MIARKPLELVILVILYFGMPSGMDKLSVSAVVVCVCVVCVICTSCFRKGSSLRLSMKT